MANKNQVAVYPIKVRQKWYFLVNKVGKTVEEICQTYAISKKTYYKWREKDLGSRTYIPKKQHPETKIKGEVKTFIVEQKNLINYGPLKMKLLVKRKFNLNISTTAIYKFYKKKGLIRRPQKKLPFFRPLKDPLVSRYPGNVVQMDAKYVWEAGVRKYQRTFIDIWTGIQFAVVTSTMTAEDTVNAFLEAEKYFPFKIIGVQTDNGSENRGGLSQTLGRERNCSLLHSKVFSPVGWSGGKSSWSH